MPLRRRGAFASLLAVLALLPGLTFFLRQRKRLDKTGASEAIVEDLQASAPGSQAAADAVLVLQGLLDGIRTADFLKEGSYDAKKRTAKFKISGGGATAVVKPEHRVWMQLHIGPVLRVSWEHNKGGSIILRLAGLSMGPLPGAHELYVRAGLDASVCPEFKAVSQQDYHNCHLEKAIVLEEFWKVNRSMIPKNLQHQFSFIGDNTIMSQLSEQLGHGFGWSMLLVLSAPPSIVQTLEFSETDGVMGTSTLDKSQPGSKLAKRHGFKDLCLNIARPLVGDTRFGSLVRTVGQRYMLIACNLGILCSVGEPRWRGRGLKGADPRAIADLFSLQGASGGRGCLNWKRRKKQKNRVAFVDCSPACEGLPFRRLDSKP